MAIRAVGHASEVSVHQSDSSKAQALRDKCICIQDRVKRLEAEVGTLKNEIKAAETQSSTDTWVVRALALFSAAVFGKAVQDLSSSPTPAPTQSALETLPPSSQVSVVHKEQAASDKVVLPASVTKMKERVPVTQAFFQQPSRTIHPQQRLISTPSGSQVHVSPAGYSHTSSVRRADGESESSATSISPTGLQSMGSWLKTGVDGTIEALRLLRPSQPQQAQIIREIHYVPMDARSQQFPRRDLPRASRMADLPMPRDTSSSQPELSDVIIPFSAAEPIGATAPSFYRIKKGGEGLELDPSSFYALDHPGPAPASQRTLELVESKRD